MMSEKTRIHLRKFDLRSIATAKQQAPINIILVGSSSSRKVACVCDAIKSSGGIVVANRNAGAWGDCKRFKIVREITPALISRTKYRVIDDENVDLRVLKDVLTSGLINVVCMSEYPNDISFAKFATYVITLGGLTQLRSIWNDFGALVPKYKDFKQIYLACTDEGDRYSDGFLIIHNDPSNKDPSDIFSWGSIHVSAVKDITVDVERQIVKTTKQKVEPVAPQPSIAQVANTADIPIQEAPIQQEPPKCVEEPKEPMKEEPKEPMKEEPKEPKEPMKEEPIKVAPVNQETPIQEAPVNQEAPIIEEPKHETHEPEEVQEIQEREPRADCTIM